MITRTIREALLSDDVRTPGFVYVVRDGEVIFYVGMSQDPPFRLAQHIGIADGWRYFHHPEEIIAVMERGPVQDALIERLLPSTVGQCILENAPEALGWAFDIYEKEDAIAAIQRTCKYETLPLIVAEMEVEWYSRRSMVEQALIDELKPYLNRSMNEHERNLPARYVKDKESQVSNPFATMLEEEFGIE